MRHPDRMAPAPDDHRPPTPPLAAAWGDALERRRHAWWAYAMHLTRSTDASEDLVQEMLMKVMSRGVRPDEVAPGYPFRVMKHAWVSWSRRKRVRDEYAARQVSPTRTERSLAPDLSRSIEALPDEQREVLTLKHGAGLTLEQIALATGRPLGTVAAQHRRAMAALRARLSTEKESTR